MGLCRQCDDFREMSMPSMARQCDRCDNAISPSVHPFFVISGVSGVGKSTLTPELTTRLPHHIVIDGDELYGLGVNFGWDVHRNTLLRIAAATSLNGRSLVQCGTIYPNEFDPMPARASVGAIHYLNLDCDDTVREERLRPRLTRLSWSEDRIQEFFGIHRNMAIEFRNGFQETMDVTRKSVQEIADLVAN